MKKLLPKKWSLIFILPLVWIGLHLLLRPKPTTAPMLIGHRGAGGLAPENTLAAIETALQHQIDAVEIDVQQSADGVLVLMHNTTVDDTTNGSGAIADLTWDQISQLNAGSHFSPQFAGEPVPSLESVLTVMQNHEATLVIEAKNPELYPDLAGDLAAMIERFEARDQVLVISFDQEWIDQFHQLAPTIPVAYLYYWASQAPTTPAIRLVSVYWPAVILDPTLVWRMHRAGFPVVVYSVNNVSLMRWLLWLGVAGIITDRPDLWPETGR